VSFPAASDASGIDHYTTKAYDALSSGSLIATVTSSSSTAIQIPGLTAGTAYWATYQATDGAATPNTTDAQSPRESLGSTNPNPGSAPATPPLTVVTPDPVLGTDTSVNLAIGNTDWDTASINWGDPAGTTETWTYPQTSGSHDYGAYSDDAGFASGYPISVTTTNTHGNCDPPAFAAALLPNPNPSPTPPGDFSLPFIEDGDDVQVDLPIKLNLAFGLLQQYLAQVSGGGGGGGGSETEVWAIGEDTPMTAAHNTITATLPGTVVNSTKAYAYIFMRNSSLGVTFSMGGTGTGTAAASGTPATTNTGKLFRYELTLSSTDAGQPVTFTTSDSSSQVMSMVIVGWTSVTGVDGTPVITSNGSSAINTHPTPAYGSSTAATNEYIESAVGGRASAGGINFNPPAGVTSFFQSKSNLASGNNVAVIVWWTLQPAIGAVAHPSATTGTGAFSVGSTTALAHP
jgi:hypothetical protein